MKFTISWLKQHLETDATLEAICDKLTALGLEVEGVADRGKSLAPFIVAHVLTAEKHPQADRLKVTTVDTGAEKIQVVCGAPNCRAGMKTVLARPGDVMPNTGEALKKGVIRGVESQGMLCARDELSLQSEETSGIIELPEDAPIGENFARYAKLDDPVIEINLTPNRPDCAGVRGIARDLAAAGMGTLKPLEIKQANVTEKSSIKIQIENEQDCPLFIGRLIRNVKNGESPAWLKQRLESIGLRPISALVDITNFLTFDCARPLHVFDAKKIKGDVHMRAVKDGEKLLALNDKEYTLRQGMTVIADDTGVISLAGIIGGKSTACDAATTDVFIEAAYFSPSRTAQTGRALQITSDARYRFERGIDPAFTQDGAELATQLIVETCGTAETKISAFEIAGKVPEGKPEIHLPTEACKKRTGVDIAFDEQTKILTALGFQVSGALVRVPSWRPDIEGVADLVEEIIRVKGYEHIAPRSVTRAAPVAALDNRDQRQHLARRALAAQGLMEAVTWSFMPKNIAALFGGGDRALTLLNPISSDLDQMRPSILGNLILAGKRNADRGFADVGLFEVGPVFANATPEGQAVHATTLRAGASPRHWNSASRPVDVFDAKADVLAALSACGAPTASLQITSDAPTWYHPGRSGALKLGAAVLAYFGEIHPEILAACDAKGPMVGCEIFIAAIPESRAKGTAKPLLKLEPLQPVTRDFAFVVGRDVTAAKLTRAVRDADKKLIREVIVFDVYEGEKIAADKKSVALSVTLQPVEKTLTDAELEDLSSRVTASVAKATGATLRG